MFFCGIFITLLLIAYGTYLFCFKKYIKDTKKTDRQINNCRMHELYQLKEVLIVFLPVFWCLSIFYIDVYNIPSKLLADWYQSFIYFDVIFNFFRDAMNSGLIFVLLILFFGQLMKFIFVKFHRKNYPKYMDESEKKKYKKDKSILIMEITSAFVVAICLIVILSIVAIIKTSNISYLYTTMKWLVILLGKFIWFDGFSIEESILRFTYEKLFSRVTLSAIILFVLGYFSGVCGVKWVTSFINGMSIGSLISVPLLIIVGIVIFIKDKIKQNT